MHKISLSIYIYFVQICLADDTSASSNTLLTLKYCPYLVTIPSQQYTYYIYTIFILVKIVKTSLFEWLAAHTPTKRKPCKNILLIDIYLSFLEDNR